MNKINWELKIDGKFKKDYDLDDIDYICDKIREGQFNGQIFVDLEDPADRDDNHYHEEQDHIAMEKAKETK